MLRFDEDDGFAGRVAEPPPDVLGALSGATPLGGRRLLLPLRSPSSGLVSGVVVLEFRDTPTLSEQTRVLVDQVFGLVEVGLERELFRHIANFDRATFYEQAIHDQLTGLYNRQYLDDAARRLSRARRPEPESGGRGAYDRPRPLQRQSTTLRPFRRRPGTATRRQINTRRGALGDIVVRYGGEEFVVLLSGVDLAAALAVAERIRESVAEPTT